MPLRFAACALATLVLLLAACTGPRSAGPHTGATAAAGSPSPQAVELPGNSWPISPAMASDGTLWVVENSIGFLASISPSGQVTQHRLADPTHAPSLSPSRLAIASDGSVWFTCPLDIGRLAPSGSVSLFQQPDIVYGSPHAIIAGPDGSIWYGGADYHGSMLVHVGASLTVARISVPAVDTADVSGLAFGPHGSLWFTEAPSDGVGRGEVGYVDSTGNSKVWPLPATADTVVGPIVPGPDGTLWFGESNAIARITTSGTISSYRTRTMKDIVDIISGPDNALWFTTLTDLDRITTAGVITRWPVPGAQELTGLVYDPHHRGFLVTDSKAAVLRWFPAPA